MNEEETRINKYKDFTTPVSLLFQGFLKIKALVLLKKNGIGITQKNIQLKNFKLSSIYVLYHHQCIFNQKKKNPNVASICCLPSWSFFSVVKVVTCHCTSDAVLQSLIKLKRKGIIRLTKALFYLHYSWWNSLRHWTKFRSSKTIIIDYLLILYKHGMK